MRGVMNLGSWRAAALLLTSLFALIPQLSWAAGGEAVELKFTSSDQMYLYISLGLGALAIVTALFLRSMVLKRSPGNDKMQEVGKAIMDGALAYLRQQVRTMAIFVVLLAGGLIFLYGNRYGWSMAGGMAVAFVAGVAASYIAGYAGMLMAVQGNMRTAHAALSSYKLSLETAFQSGAVAGLFTVGMGLIGATIIFLVGGNNAMILLIGFGFGGSLAALFMRVGGGIFTKAADVGADLVGKVEAGIPEDDPRNPATIADNVGDNVGDCAGMAADVFESYEVTLVAAIVLGAATASIFDQATWMKLVLFALMARGAGIVASIIGIFTMKGSDNLDDDPLMRIRKGFFSSAAVAAVLTVGVTLWMMQGINTNQLVPIEKFARTEAEQVQAVARRIALEKKIPVDQVSAQDLQASAEIKALELDKPEMQQAVQQMASQDLGDVPEAKGFTGYSLMNPDELTSVAGRLSAPRPMDPANPPKPDESQFVDFATAYGSKEPYIVAELNVTQTPAQPPVERGQPTPPPPTPVTQKVMIGPISKNILKKQIEEATKNPQLKVEPLNEYPVTFYSDGAKVVAAIDGKIKAPQRVRTQPVYYLASPIKDLQRMEQDRKTDASKPLPQQVAMKVAVVEHTPVEWWRFLLCIVFGIAMAFAIEFLTDYYVSTHKKPVNEVANVATAGPAPMIIQGFAFAAESSVFTVFALVIALIMPLFIFPPAQFGGYILSFYGIALVGLGLLTTTGYILAMDTFGPISDNAQGVFEMSGAGHEHPEASKAVQRLDAAGNTTKALTKGFAIATAVIAAVALFHSYLDEAKLADVGLRLDIPEIFLGLMIGAAAPYLFSAFTINAVGRASFELINEVRRQFRNDSGIMAGTSKPDYGRCVAIVTAAAQKELLGPGILAIGLPVLVGFGFSIGKEPTAIGGAMFNLTGAEALGGFLAGAIVSGQLLAVLLANSGGMWDNAKKLIEDGLHGGKGTEAHKAGVVCDTVGDPFKDTAGPALNPLIKVMNLVALLLAPVVILPLSTMVLGIIAGSALVALIIAFWWSKRGSMSTGLAAAQADTGSAQKAVSAPKVDDIATAYEAVEEEAKEEK